MNKPKHIGRDKRLTISREIFPPLQGGRSTRSVVSDEVLSSIFIKLIHILNLIPFRSIPTSISISIIYALCVCVSSPSVTYDASKEGTAQLPYHPHPPTEPNPRLR